MEASLLLNKALILTCTIMSLLSIYGLVTYIDKPK